MLLGGITGRCSACGWALEGSLLIQVRQGARLFWRFKHPTIRDAFASLVAEDPELIGHLSYRHTNRKNVQRGELW